MIKNVTTVGRTARIVQSYSPDGANLHAPSRGRFLGLPRVPSRTALRTLIVSSVFAGFVGLPNARTQTTQRATSAAIGRVSAMNAMRPLITPRPIEPPQSNLVIHSNVSK